MSLSWFQEITNHSANENVISSDLRSYKNTHNSPEVEQNITTTVLSIKHQLESWQQYMEKNFESELV